MATRRVEIGPIGHAVRENLVRLRADQGLTLRALADLLTPTGQPLSHNAISEIERGARRVDVDDLVALALALQVSPLALLLPHENSEVSPGGEVYPQQRIWNWALGLDPLPGMSRDPLSMLRFVKHSNPIEYAEAARRQAAGEVNPHPVAVPRVAAKQQRAQRREATKEATATEYGPSDGDD
ncbi:helix-turn-helix domain-containing protein [Nocardia higoensis]|uniref:Helix-turn-helix domain-containing protein n=1 Tax=Nocardia higoensis TaxID=228599 RepID=A0ABS0DIU8_9NOCA|nr:helix-turn-helix transcriptional regulator [Nocardia higoensis]MBF6358380.1 helix-turn-helix domain-containing protein [Nocardia higoensis]